MPTPFETTTCSRCGGGGSYSFNLMHGSRCYGCGGSGITYTKRGKAARKLFHDLMRVEASKVQPGWLVNWSDLTISGKDKWVRVADVQLKRGTVILNGVPQDSIEFTTQGGNKISIDTGYQIRAVESLTHRDTALAQALEYQNSLNPKTGKPERAKAAA